MPFTVPPPLSLYVHVPWCVRKCPYCDFNSHEAGTGALPEAAYIDALLADLEQELPAVWGRPLRSLFIGGGTPSLLSPEAVDRLLSGIRARLRLPPDAEVTLETNPGTVERGRFAEFRAAGVNRLSLGVQSFNDELLKRIGRIHDGAAARAAAEGARAAGFERLNLDLMFGLPGQTPAQTLADLNEALAIDPGHLSWYQLTIEPNTRFHHAPPPLPEEEALWTMQREGEARLAAAGYRHYEVSAYARPGERCRHNLNYWEFGDYLGIGAGAHGKITDAPGGTVRRRWKRRHPADYLAGAGTPAGTDGEQTLSTEDIGFEFMLGALRLREGFAEALFAERTGLALEGLAPALEAAQARGLLERAGGRIAPTERGRLYLNDLLALFLPDEETAPR